MTTSKLHVERSGQESSSTMASLDTAIDMDHHHGLAPRGDAADWKAAALELWLCRAKRRWNTKSPLTHFSLRGEVKQWKPERLPPGVTHNQYARAVVQALKESPLITYDPTSGTLQPVVAPDQIERTDSHSSITAPVSYTQGAATNTPATHSDASPAQVAPQLTIAAEIEYYVANIGSLSQPLTLSVLSKLVKARVPKGGYKGPKGEPLGGTKFYKLIKQTLKKDARVLYDKTKGNKGFVLGRNDEGADMNSSDACVRVHVHEGVTSQACAYHDASLPKSSPDAQVSK